MQLTNTLRNVGLHPRAGSVSYLLMARDMLRCDPGSARRQLGLSERSADVLLRLTPAQILRLSATAPEPAGSAGGAQ